MDLGLKGKNVLITGASQGIGEGLAMSFAREGSDLLLVARSADKLAAVSNLATAAFSVRTEVLSIDITAPRAIDQIAAFGRDADVLINNAGNIPGGDLWDVDEAQWRAGWELKVFGYINLTRAMYPLMKARGGGVIINNIGSGGENFDFNYIAGTTGNAALMAFTRALGGRSLADDHVRVIGVNPGPVDTDRVRSVLAGHAQRLHGDSSRFAELLANYPLRRAASVDEITELFVYLASDKSAYTSGAIFTVDGGLTSRRSVG